MTTEITAATTAYDFHIDDLEFSLGGLLQVMAHTADNHPYVDDSTFIDCALCNIRRDNPDTEFDEDYPL